MSMLDRAAWPVLLVGCDRNQSDNGNARLCMNFFYGAYPHLWRHALPHHGIQNVMKTGFEQAH